MKEGRKPEHPEKTHGDELQPPVVHHLFSSIICRTPDVADMDTGTAPPLPPPSLDRASDVITTVVRLARLV